MIGFFGDFEKDKDVFPDIAGRSTVIPFSSKTPILCGVAPPGFVKIANTRTRMDCRTRQQFGNVINVSLRACGAQLGFTNGGSN